MSTQRLQTARRTPVEWAADGLPLCRWCNKKLPNRRRRFCSEPCVHEWSLRSSTSYLRARLFERDKGICAACKADTMKMRRILMGLKKGFWKDWTCKGLPDHAAWQWYAETLNVGLSRAFCGSLWDADHILPVVEGGGLCGLEGFQTLCVGCHKAKTREMHRRKRANR